jgi:hypothetical protein
VRIEDDDHRPVSGVAVVFALPVSGSSGEFTNGSKNLTVVTGNDGVATANGLRTNEVPGKLQIYVTASYHSLRSRTLINQTIEGVPGAPPPSREVHTSKSGGGWKWVVLGVVAAGAAGGAFYFKGRNSTPVNTVTPISISSGTVVFGSPR